MEAAPSGAPAAAPLPAETRLSPAQGPRVATVGEEAVPNTALISCPCRQSASVFEFETYGEIPDRGCQKAWWARLQHRNSGRADWAGSMETCNPCWVNKPENVYRTPNLP